MLQRKQSTWTEGGTDHLRAALCPLHILDRSGTVETTTEGLKAATKHFGEQRSFQKHLLECTSAVLVLPKQDAPIVAGGSQVSGLAAHRRAELEGRHHTRVSGQDGQRCCRLRAPQLQGIGAVGKLCMPPYIF